MRGNPISGGAKAALGVAFSVIILCAGVFGLVKTDFTAKAIRVFTVASMEAPSQDGLAATRGEGFGKGLGGGERRESGGGAARGSVVNLGEVGLWFLTFAFFVCATAWAAKGARAIGRARARRADARRVDAFRGPSLRP